MCLLRGLKFSLKQVSNLLPCLLSWTAKTEFSEVLTKVNMLFWIILVGVTLINNFGFLTCLLKEIIYEDNLTFLIPWWHVNKTNYDGQVSSQHRKSLRWKLHVLIRFHKYLDLEKARILGSTVDFHFNYWPLF